MLPTPSVRRRIAALLGVLALAAAGATTVVAPAADAAPRPVPRWGLGLQPSPPDAVAAMAVPLGTADYGDAPLPASVDLTPWAMPSGNQGQIGSCVSWTVGYSISGWYARRQGQAGTPYAPLFLYNQLTGGRGGATTGTTFYGNLTLETDEGIVPLADFPAGNYNPAVIPSAAQEALAANYRLTSWNTLYYNQSQSAASGQQLIKQALAAEKPVALGIRVYQNFYYVTASNQYYGAVSGAYQGRHAVTVLGYDSYGVRIQNSWGTTWGSNGFAWLSWGFLAAYSDEAYVVNGFTAPSSGPAPVISSLSATSGPWTGGTVTITGTDLAGATVTFGSTASSSVTVNGGGASLTATVPPAAPGAVAVSVTTPSGGRSNAVTYTYTADAPTITSLSPARGPSTGGTTVTITGTNLRQLSGSAYTVRFGSTAATNVVVASDGLSATATAPSGAIGDAQVTVTNAGGTSAAATYTYDWPVTPTLTLTQPKNTTMKPGVRLSLVGALRLPSGTGVQAAVQLQSRPKGSTGAYETVAATTSSKAGKVTFGVFPGASAEYRLATAGGVTSSSLVITVQPPPTVTGLSVTSGVRTGGGTVTLTGANLAGARVTVGAVPASSVIVADDGSSLSFVVPPRAKAGQVAVVVVTATGKATSPVKYAYTAS